MRCGRNALLVAVVAGRWMAGRALAPLARFAEATRAISVANLQQHLPVRGAADELDAIANAFNEMLTRLEQAVGDMKQFSAALAHELRTPLAALRGETELAVLRARTPEGLPAWAHEPARRT
jgi:signal transduction histidine kinase